MPESFVLVLVDGVFNDPEQRAQRASAGDHITVSGGWYVESLIKDGFVALANPNAAPTYQRWIPGQNMEGVGPHIAASFPDRTPPDMSALVDLALDLNELDAALDGPDP